MQTSLVRGWGRVLRGLTLSIACLLVPTAAHIVAGGGFPAAGPFLFCAALLSAACVALSDRQLGPGGITVLVFAAQPAFHLLLNLSAHGHDPAAASPGVGMVAGHVVAAGVLTLLLGRGEAVLWSLVALSSIMLLRRVRLLLRSVPPPQRVRPLLSRTSGAVVPYVMTVTRISPRRGPPVLLGI